MSRYSRGPTIRDVAKQSGVSYQTVSRVINGSDRVRETTRARVMEVMRDLGYEPDPMARELGRHKRAHADEPTILPRSEAREIAATLTRAAAHPALDEKDRRDLLRIAEFMNNLVQE